MATDGPDPQPCNPKIFAEGDVVFVGDSVSSNRMERWVTSVARASGQCVDWHFFGGRAVVKALGDIQAVQNAIAELMPEYDRLRAESLQRYAV